MARLDGYPSTLFELTDNRLSRYWVLDFDEENNIKTPYLSFQEWANNPFFYKKLIEGDFSSAQALTFQKYKDLMDLEFPDSLISENAQLGDEEWLICPTCIDRASASKVRDCKHPV